MKKEKIRGKLLYRGVTGKYYDTIGGQLKVAIFLIFSICLMVVLACCTILFNWTLAGSSVLGSAIWLFLGAIFFILLYAVGGIDLDAIYEKGISSAHHTLIEYIRRRTFHPYETITKIGCGIKKQESTHFLSLYLNNESSPGIRAYYENDYKNDFYKRLVEALKQHGPNAQWEEVDWDSLPFTKG